MPGILNQLGQDLLKIEINTIVKEEITGEKLPFSLRQALYEIAKNYDLKLQEIGKYNNVVIREPINFNSGGISSFKELRERALTGAKKLSALRNIPINDINKLYRIEGHCFKLIGIFKRLEEEFKTKKRRKKYPTYEWQNDFTLSEMNRLPDLKLNRRDLSLIQKLKDIGTEEIYLQTIIQLDGDITNRISSKFMNNFNDNLLNIHNEGVSFSLKYWNRIVEIALTAFGKIIKR